MPDLLHISLLVDEDCIERFEPVVRQLSVGLIDEAIRTTIIGPRVPRIESLAMGPIQVKTHDRLTGWGGKRVLAELIERIGEQPPNLFHAMSPALGRLAAQLGKANDVPYVVSVTGLDEITPETEPALRSASGVIAISEPIRAHVMQRLGLGAQHLVRIRWGLLPGQQPASFSETQRNPTIVAISPLTADSGLDQLIEAVGGLSSLPLPPMLFILGTGPAEEGLRQHAAKLKLNERVTFAGIVREWPSVLAGADIFVMPARQTRMTIHPLSAMGAGLVVVAAGEGAYDCLIDGQTARLYHPPSADLLAAALAETIATPSESCQLAGRSQTYIREHHRVSSMVNETVAVYRHLTLSQKTIPLMAPDSQP